MVVDTTVVTVVGDMSVVVGGRVVVADGVHQSIDVATELQRSIATVWS